MEIDFDFNGSLRLSEVVEDFFHSPSTGLYVFRHPLIVDARVRGAADALGIRVQASPEKWLVNAPLADCLRLLERLGSRALSLPEWFRVRRDALEAGDADMAASLESDRFIEMLDTVFLRDREMIRHPRVAQSGFEGERIPCSTPVGRYGWVRPEDIDLETGLPTRVGFRRDLGDDSIKYWDTHTDIGRSGTLMAVRGFVTSVGKISLDLGFPADAVSPKLTIRECLPERPKGVLDPRVLTEARELAALCETAHADGSLYAGPLAWRDRLLEFVIRDGGAVRNAGDLAGEVLREGLRDALGALWLSACARGKKEEADRVRGAASLLSGLTDGDLTDRSFREFACGGPERLRRAVESRGSVVFVMGHANPDTDSVASSLAEALRQHLLRGREEAFVPVVASGRVPEEAAALLGADIADRLVLAESEAYRTASSGGRPEWIMVDRNVGPEQADTRSMIDHHNPDPVCLSQKIPRRVLFAGSTTALVALRFYGMGLDIPPAMARILHGATLMDTEDRFPGKMTPLDALVMDRLRDAGGTQEESLLYRDLMRHLVSGYDPDFLFRRDYKEDWCFFGFAVAKAIRILDPGRAPLLDRLKELAAGNNVQRGLPLTLLKAVDYDGDAETIRRERLVPIFAAAASPEFRQAVLDAVRFVVRLESPPSTRVAIRDGAVDYWGAGSQLSRKKLAPVLDPVVTAFHRHFHSRSTGLYLLRDFLRWGPAVEEAVRRHGLSVRPDGNGVAVGNPGELKLILQELGMLCASPAEYFAALRDAEAAGDLRMAAHLVSPRYLETLDAIVEDRSTLVEHPVMRRTEGGLAYEGGARRAAAVPEGSPGLFDPRQVDPATGLPTRVEDPRQYGTGLWRYWSPDSGRAWALRSTIFAYGMPALDLKFGFEEALPRLTIRPCVRSVAQPRVRVREEGERILVEVQEP